MTTTAEELQQAMTAAFRAWGSVTTAWVQAAETMFATVVEWAVEETVLTAVNETVVYVRSEKGCTLCPELHWSKDPKKALLSPDVVTVTPTSLPAMAAGAPAVAVTVGVKALPGVASGFYRGRLVDEHGDEVEPDVHVPVMHTVPA